MEEENPAPSQLTEELKQQVSASEDSVMAGESDDLTERV